MKELISSIGGGGGVWILNGMAHVTCTHCNKYR